MATRFTDAGARQALKLAGWYFLVALPVGLGIVALAMLAWNFITGLFQ